MSEAHDGAAEAVTEDLHDAQIDDAQNETSAADVQAEPGDDAAAAGDEPEGDKPRRKSPQERIDEVTRARREAERDRDYWREQAMQTSRREDPRPTEQTEDAEPDPNNYEHGDLDARFIRDHAVYHARQTFRQEQAQAEARNRARSAVATFEQRIGEQFPDGEPEGIARLRAMPTLSPAVQEAIFDSDIGPKLADHLGQNARELNRISALPPLTQMRELAKLELKLASPPVPIPKTATDAPAPTPQVRGAGGRFTVAADTTNFADFDKQY